MFDYTLQPGMVKNTRYSSGEFKPLVSIVTPVYNRLTYFEQTCNCVLNQTFPWFEWIIVDDGSKDQSCRDFLDTLPQRDSRIRVIHQENGGAASARNTGFKNAQAEIIIPLDDDDLIIPTYVDEMYWALQKNPEASWAYASSCAFGDQEYTWEKEFTSDIMKKENLLIMTSAIRKSAHEEIGGFLAGVKGLHEDWHYWLKMLEKEKFPVHTANIGFWYRRLAGTMISQNGTVNEPIEKLIPKIKDGISGIEIPAGNKARYTQPKKSDFPYKVANPGGKKRLLFILPWLEMGGADKFNLDLIRMLDSEKYEVSVVTTNQANNGWLQEFEKYAFETFVMPGFMEPDAFPEFVSYLIESRGIDLVMVSNSYPGYAFLPWLRANYPEMAILSYVHMETWYWRNGGYSRCAADLRMLTDGICICNENSRKVMINDFGCAPDEVETVYIGVDAEHFDPAIVKAGDVRKECGLGDRPIVLFPCRINEQKRPYLMLKIADELRRRVKDVAFVVVGDGEEKAGIDNKIKELKLEDTVYMVGERKEMRPYYRDADVTLICSIKEGLALTAYESCAMATPVVTSDVGGQAELINDKVGKVLPLLQDEATELNNYDYSDEEIALYVDSLYEILTDKKLREEKGRLSRERILGGFDLKNMAIHMDKEFEKAMEISRKKRGLYEEFAKFAPVMAESHMYYSDLLVHDEMGGTMTGWYNQQIANYQDEVARQNSIIAELREWVADLENAKSYFIKRIGELENHSKEINVQKEEIEKYKKKIASLEDELPRHSKSKKWWKFW